MKNINENQFTGPNISINPELPVITKIALEKIVKGAKDSFRRFLEERNNQIEAGAITKEDANEAVKEIALQYIQNTVDMGAATFLLESRKWIEADVFSRETASLAVRDLIKQKLIKLANKSGAEYKVEKHNWENIADIWFD